MSAVATTQAEVLLAAVLDEREMITRKWEAVNEAIAAREDKTPTEVENEHVTMYREKVAELDARAEQLSGDIEGTRKAIENSKAMRRALSGVEGGVEEKGDGIVYRSFAAYARDVILTRETPKCLSIQKLLDDPEANLRARERLGLLKRDVANTLSSDVEGLQAPEHIAQIFQVIDTSRPIVASAMRSSLTRGTLTYPKVSQRPLVAVQASEKTQGGNQAMNVDMETTTASVYQGGGDLSWQAINWSSPDALRLWFDLAAASYALLTEEDAAQVITDDGFVNKISSTIASWSFADLLTGVGAGATAVYTATGRQADTVYMAVDAFWTAFGLTSDAFAQFAQISAERIGPLRFVVSRGLDTGTIIVGDSKGLLVAETAGAPVELNVVEPAIGGVEVGLIGAFEAVVVDTGAFSLITTAS